MKRSGDPLEYSPLAIIRDENRWLNFSDAPVQIFETNRLDEVIPLLRRVEKYVDQNSLYAVGFLSYEAAPAFDRTFQSYSPTDFPLIWFGIFNAPQRESFVPKLSSKIADIPENWTSSVDRTEFNRAIEQIKISIANGETYQVNYTFRLRSKFYGNPLELFQQLISAQRSEHAAYIDTGNFVICSASPELFFQLDNLKIITRPMKGTIDRGLTFSEDEIQSQRLRNSEKDRAENLMVVDMMRNELGKISDFGTVAVRTLFRVEKYPTLWQMTSTVEAQTSATITEVMTALFPPASVTGAPKIETMKIINKQENSERKIYTGAIGFIAPNRRAKFNVAIRTALVDRKNNSIEYGVGSGIVWDSEKNLEFEECKLKAKILRTSSPDFSLLETLLWDRSDYFLLPYHLRRLKNSATYFDFNLDHHRVKKELYEITKLFSGKVCKVRLTVNRDGKINCEITEIEEKPNRPVSAKLAYLPIDSSDKFIYHKTTNRKMYDRISSEFPEHDEVILWNERGELTESCTANLVLRFGNLLLTPPVKCGLLAGTFRASLLERDKIQEKIITVEEIKFADEIFLINSVRKWQSVDRLRK